MNQTTLDIQDLGITGYGDTLALQQSLCAKRIADQIPNTILLTEHKPVITAGARKTENKLLVSVETIQDREIDYFTVGRGGGTTAHNPGQIVIYPIVKLKSVELGLNEFVHTLEQIGIDLLLQYDIHAHTRKDAPGLWIEHRKIGSIGIQAKHWVTMHGMAINLCNDLSIFNLFVPCGLDGVKMTSAEKETGHRPDMQDVKDRLGQLCRRTFSRRESEVS